MVETTSCNCIVCAKEFDKSELNDLAFSKINLTKFKICKGCLDMCDPATDYKEARDIINSYVDNANSKLLFAEAKDMIKSIKVAK